MPVGFSYLRFSRPEQAKGDSRRRQEAFAPEFCKRNNITLNETLRFADEGKSGFKGAHLKSDGALTRFLQHIERGDVKRGDYLIVENVDRLTRQSLYEAEGLLFSILEKGVKIGTQSPPKIYTKKSLNNLSDRIELTIYLARANSESIEKQRRLFEANERKRELAKQGKKTRLALPRWLEFQGDEIVEIPERVKVVQRVFKLSIEGHGLEAIVKQLNQDGVPTFGSARHWARSSVSKLLNARAVLGEYQPFSTVGYDDEAEQLVNVPRRPVGKPIKGYFPQIVSAADFDACARGRRNRKTHHGGRGADKVRNLFTGLIFDARDGSAMHCVDKGDGPRLISHLAVKGLSERTPIPYDLIEKGFGAFGKKLPLAAALPASRAGDAKKIEKLEVMLRKLERQIASIKNRLESLEDNEDLLDLLASQSAKKKTLANEIDELQSAGLDTASPAVKTSKELLAVYRKAPPEEQIAMRTRLRAELPYWIKRIDVLPLVLGGVRAAKVNVEMQNGKSFQFDVATTEDLIWPEELVELPFKKWKTAKRVWGAESLFDKQMLELDNKGLPQAEIAKQLDTTVAVVSRAMIRLGRRRTKRTPRTADNPMSWSETARGWCRTYKGQRYYVGVGTLKKLYPRMVRETTREGTERAAKRWWKEHGGDK